MNKLWTQDFIRISLAMLLLVMAFYVLIPTLPVFVKQLGGTESQIGLVTGIFTLSAVLVRPLSGGLIDRYGRRPFMIGGLMFFALTMYLYDWVGGLVYLVALRMFHGVSWAISTNAIATTVTDIIPSVRRGEGMGWFGMFTTLGMAVGPVIGVWITDNYSFHALFLLATGFSGAAFLLAYVTNISFPYRNDSGRMSFLDKSVLPTSLVTFFMTISYGGIITFFPLFAGTITVNPGTFFLAYAVTLALVRPIAGKLTDRYGESAVIIPALGISVAACLTLAASTGLFGVLVSAILYGIGFGAAQPALQAATINLSPPEKKGIANASFLTAFDLGIGLGAIALGAVSQYMGYRTLFCVASASGLAALILFSVYSRGILKNRKTQSVNGFK